MQTTHSHPKALWYTAAGQVELRSEPVLATGPGQCQVQAICSGVSRGTESLVLQGRVPPSEFERMKAPFMGGSFPFPVKYGYSHVGIVTDGPAEMVGQRVFSLSPHQSVITLPTEALAVIPASVDSRRAVLAANMETALNAVWTGKPGPADRIAIVGAGIVGLLVGYLCSHLPGASVTVIDPLPARQPVCQALGLQHSTDASTTSDCDVVFHASASTDGLNTALNLAGNEASIVELSWYGNQPVAAMLGQAFHSRQIRLLSCQVGHIEASHRPRWDYRRRLAAAIEMLADARLDCLLESPIRIEDAPARLADILKPGSTKLCQVIDYDFSTGA